MIMATIDINYATYVPAPSVYYSYFELLKAHHFIENPEETQNFLTILLENLNQLEN